MTASKIDSVSPSPLVSVVMPAFNAGRFILESINSVKKQTESRWELIIVDDCSTDNTAEVVKGEVEIDNRIRFYGMHSNGGPSVTRNVGIAKARGEFIAFLDADDLFSPDAISERVSVLNENKFACGSYCDARSINEEGKNIGNNYVFKDRVSFLDLIENKFPTSFVMLRADILKEEGGFDEALRFGEDWDLWLRVTRTGRYLIKATNCLIHYRQYSKSLTHPRILQDCQQRLTVLERSWSFDPNSNNPLPEFKKGLGGALKSEAKTKRAFVTAVVELAAGKEDNAHELMRHVSLNVLALLDYDNISSQCNFMAKRTFCINENEWLALKKQLFPKFDIFFKVYRTVKLDDFFNNFFNQFFLCKYQNKLLKSNKIFFYDGIKKICNNTTFNKIFGFLYSITSKINSLFLKLYSIKK